jgi:hypothetical protein
MSIEFLYKALETPLGIVVETNNPELLRQKLYALRKEAMNPEFDQLVFKPSTSKPESELWIIKQPPKDKSNGSP